MINVLGLSLYGAKAASHRVRLSQFQSGLSEVGIKLEIKSLLNNYYLKQKYSGSKPSLFRILQAFLARVSTLRNAKDFDLAIIYGELFPLMPACIEKRLLLLPYLFDFDDAFYLKYISGKLGIFKPLLGRKFESVMSNAAAITAGNQHLASYARQFNKNVIVLPSVVDTNNYRPALKVQSECFTVGWIGSPTTAPYLEALVEPLMLLSKEKLVRFVVMGGKAPKVPGVEVVELPWSLDEEVSLIQSFDVGVMPLPDSPWARGKCAYKLLQCMACGVPVVASPVGANVDAVPSTCGILVSTPNEWLEAFRVLANDPDQCNRMGNAARVWVVQNYSLDVALPILSKAINEIHALKRSL